MLVLSTNDCKSIIVLTSGRFVCVGEAAAPLMAAVEPSQSTNDLNSFVTPRERSCDGRGDS